jgi:hypothetical protein
MKKLTAFTCKIFFILVMPSLFTGCAKKTETASTDIAMADFKLEKDKSNQSDSDKLSTWKRSETVPNTPKLFIGDKEELPLKGMQMTVQVDGFRARVLMDCYYYNDRNFQAEGTFKLKLPNDASPYYFAFGESILLDKSNTDDKEWKIPFLNYTEKVDLSPESIKKDRDESWKDVKEATIVPKEKATYAYSQTVRANIDPALMEWAGADIFNCRVFPLQPNEYYRIVIGYDVNLLETSAGRILILGVPNSGNSMKLDMDLSAEKGNIPVIEPTMKIEKDGSRIKIHAADPYADEIKIIYKVKDPVLLTGEDLNGQNFVASSFVVDLPEASSEKTSENAILMMDISLSSNPDKFNVWLKMAEAILKNNSSEIKNFNVLFFNVEQFWWKENLISNTPENIDAFVKYARGLSLEGASDPGAALEKTSLFLDQMNLSSNIFFLSDAAVTWGEDDLYLLSAKIKNGNSLYGYKTGMEGTDLRLLEHLTQASGGKLFSVLNESEIAIASTAYRKASWKIDGMTMGDVSDLLIAGRPQYFYSGQTVIVAGRGIVGKGSKISFNLSAGNVKKKLDVSFPDHIKSSLTGRVYGQIATAQLEKFSYYTEKYSKAYASYFRVPGQTSSFLMLDTEEDYKRFNIRPEEDLFVVKTFLVSDLIREISADIEKLLANPKEGFKNWISRLPEFAGVEFELPTSIDVLIEKTPVRSFNSIPAPMHCKLRMTSDMKQSSLDELYKAEPDYDVITTEALKRKEMFGTADGLKFLSSLVEKNPGDGVLIRDVGFSAMEWGMDAHACHLFKKLLRTRPYEPQTYHALAQVYSKMKNADLAILYYELCLAGKWDERFGDFRTIVIMDYLSLLNEIEKGIIQVSSPEYPKSRKLTLQKELGMEKSDLAIVIMWNTDNTDIDLHVTEPSGEECYYSHPKTKSGGNMTKDVTQGYGPEMYALNEMENGEYLVRAHYYSRDRSRASVRTKIYATIYRSWGSKNEKVLKKTITLTDDKEYQEIIRLKENWFDN